MPPIHPFRTSKCVALGESRLWLESTTNILASILRFYFNEYEHERTIESRTLWHWPGYLLAAVPRIKGKADRIHTAGRKKAGEFWRASHRPRTHRYSRKVLFSGARVSQGRRGSNHASHHNLCLVLNGLACSAPREGSGDHSESRACVRDRLCNLQPSGRPNEDDGRVAGTLPGLPCTGDRERV
jgi:hypothetical protein